MCAGSRNYIHTCCICLATSKDGIAWTKPELGVIEYEGSRKNNIVVGHGAAGFKIGQDGVMVFIDPLAPSEERYRMACRFGASKDAVNVLSSGDGIHWRQTSAAIITARPEVKGHHLDSQNVVFYDEQLKKYVCYVRRNLKSGPSQGRSIARGESAKLDGFGDVQDMPVILSPDEADRPGEITLIDYYSSAAIKYPWADSAYYMFPQAYFHYTGQLAEFKGGKPPTNAGALDTQFAASTDGLKWERFNRTPFIDLGMKGQFDCYSARILYGIVPSVDGNEMYMYYRASDWLHGWDRNEQNKEILTKVGLAATQNLTPISRVVLRRDGFVSVRAGVAGGEFVTPPLQFKGTQLVINADTSAIGNVQVEVQDAEGAAIEGFRLADCDVIHTCNEVSRPVRWNRASDLSRLDGKTVRLRFVLRSADLYAFQFGGTGLAEGSAPTGR